MLARQLRKNIDTRSEVNELLYKRSVQTVRRLSAYPLIFIFVWLIAFINRVQQYVNPDQPVFVLWILNVIAVPLQGVLNGIAFIAYDSTVTCNRKELKMTLLSWCSEEERENQRINDYPLAIETTRDDDHEKMLTQEQQEMKEKDLRTSSIEVRPQNGDQAAIELDGNDSDSE